MENRSQEIHLWPDWAGVGPLATDPGTADVQAPVRLPFAPAALSAAEEGAQLLVLPGAGVGARMVAEPFFNQRKQLRLLVIFFGGDPPLVNGEPAPRFAVLSAGDFFQWSNGIAFHVVVFNKPQLGSPPGAFVGKPCPVCRVPFVAETTCYTCACGVVLHCEADEKEGLQCAQMRGECPVCKRPVVLTEGYASTPSHED